MEQLIFRQIDKKELAYRQALSLRYQIFFQPHSLPQSIIIDEDEANAFHFACFRGDEPVAYVRVNIMNTEASLSQMLVTSAHRGTGIGGQLVRMAENFIYEQSVSDDRIKKIILNARIEARKFYERLGYKSVGEVFASKKTGLPHIRMEKILIYSAR